MVPSSLAVATFSTTFWGADISFIMQVCPLYFLATLPVSISQEMAVLSAEHETSRSAKVQINEVTALVCPFSCSVF